MKKHFIWLLGLIFFNAISSPVFSQEEVKGKEKISSEAKRSDTVYRHNQAVRYFGSYTAFPLKKENWYVRNEMLILNSFSYGVGNRLTVGAGLKSNLPSMVYGWFLEGKYSFIYKRYFSAAAGLCVNYDFFPNLVSSTAENKTSLSAYLITTLGNDRINASFRMDPYGYSHLAETGGSIASLSLKTQIFRGFSFIAENHGFIPWDESPFPVRYCVKIQIFF